MAGVVILIRHFGENICTGTRTTPFSPRVCPSGPVGLRAVTYNQPRLTRLAMSNDPPHSTLQPVMNVRRSKWMAIVKLEATKEKKDLLPVPWLWPQSQGKEGLTNFF
ncbi:hypothetical protein E2C01_028684 [Portunus trituberculatus]|uniref:Uncharacterized protein n=1 Tax=Portunus trituberculatus TaxID=210409 RepID=A0A5B7ESE7_PORTR|nr:hypothetical protein [Portunus trituberculatus]